MDHGGFDWRVYALGLEAEIERLRQEINLRDITIEAQGRVLDRLNDERPAYPGAWVEEIERLKEENNRLHREREERYAGLEEEITELENANRVLRERVHALVDESNSHLDEIVEAIEDFRHISSLAAMTADRLDK